MTTPDDPNVYENYYFKDRPKGMTLMSGFPLPKSEDGKIHNVRFVECTFHPNCDPSIFVDCEFINCDGPD